LAKSHTQKLAAPSEPTSGLDMTDEQLQAVDAAVGAQVRLRRILLGLSQQAVSGILGLTFQQLQKYEHGANRISASRLFQLSKILHVPVSFFFDTVETEHESAPRPEKASTDQAVPAELSGFMQKRRTVELVRCFYGLEESQRRAVLAIVKSMSQEKKS
jgi:transcriptional regulator with XRE-family HTH domain